MIKFQKLALLLRVKLICEEALPVNFDFFLNFICYFQIWHFLKRYIYFGMYSER